jgi:hypothetical protein
MAFVVGVAAAAGAAGQDPPAGQDKPTSKDPLIKVKGGSLHIAITNMTGTWREVSDRHWKIEGISCHEDGYDILFAQPPSCSPGVPTTARKLQITYDNGPFDVTIRIQKRHTHVTAGKSMAGKDTPELTFSETGHVSAIKFDDRTTCTFKGQTDLVDLRIASKDPCSAPQ